VAAIRISQMMVQAGEGAVETAAVKSAPVEAATVKSATVKSAPVEAAKSAATEPAGVKSAPVKSSAAVGRGIGEVWLKHSSAQQSSCDYYQSPPASGSGAIFF
jgi:hypothetical protein